MSQAPETLEGWWMLHDIRRIDWPRWKQLAADERRAVLAEATEFFRAAVAVDDADEGASGLYRMVGQKGDLMQIHLRPTPQQLNALEIRFAQLRLADFLLPAYGYFSVVEMSRHNASESIEQMLANPYVQQRLKPALPAVETVCFYPMSKKREGQDNWYWESPERRREMMRDHGMIGRRYADRVTQIISGSTGLDDWEWGVTLFADDPLQYKKIVYEMRFDEASARFGLFGPFYIGFRLPPEQLEALFTGDVERLSASK